MKTKILIALLAQFALDSVVGGFLDARHLSETVWWSVTSALIIGALIYYWYRLDSTEKAFNRTYMLTVGIVAIAPLAVPLYLYRSNERGYRLRPFGRMLAYVCVVMVISEVADRVGRVIG